MPKNKTGKKNITKSESHKWIIVATLLLVVFLLVAKYSVRTSKISPHLESVLPTPTEFPSRPQPEITKWKIYTNGSFSFEYPSFMPEPTIYWPGEETIRYISIYTWQIDKMSSGNYEHNIYLRIEGPYPDSSKKDLVNWIKDQGWPYHEGELQEMAGKSQITYKTLQGRKLVQSVFRETDSENIRGWTLYLNGKSGIYRIDFNVQGSEEELAKYQIIFEHLLSTFRFLK